MKKLALAMLFLTGCGHLLTDFDAKERTHPVYVEVIEAAACAGLGAWYSDIDPNRDGDTVKTLGFLYLSTCAISLIADTTIEVMERTE